MSDHLIWFDLETTGVSSAVDLVLEWAAVITDDALQPVEEYSAVIKRTRYQLSRETRDPYVQAMHDRSGLWKACEHDPEASTLIESDAFLFELCQNLTGHESPRGIELAGATVHFDLGFVRACFPQFATCLSHRVFDTSTLTKAARLWGGHRLALGTGADAHRALDDVRITLEKARWLRSTIGWAG